MKKVIFIVGPTASGKTEVSISLAKKLNSEIISADSMQIYKGLNIGTAKISKDEMEGITHHLIDFLPVTSSFSVVEYKEKADKIIKECHKKNIIPIVVGGTGLYIQSLLYDLDFYRTKPDMEFRSKLEKYTNKELYNKLLKLSKNRANKLHFNNRRRIIRAIEIEKKGNGKSGGLDKPRTDIKPIIFNIITDPNILHERIENRIDKMINDGLIEECEKILLPIGREYQSSKAIGYAETIDYLKGLMTFKEYRQNLIVHTRQYAKRQRTWFRRFKNAHKVKYNETDKMEKIVYEQ